MNQNLYSKLASYSSLAGAIVFIPCFSDGQIVFNDVYPDLVVDVNNPFASIDINNDGLADFKFSHTPGSDAPFFGDALNYNHLLFCVIGITGAAAFSYRAYLSTQQNSYYWGGSAEIWGLDAWFYQDFTSDLKFLPVRLLINGAYHYGWVRLEITNADKKLYIREYAYHTLEDFTFDIGVAGTFTDFNEPNEKSGSATSINTNTDYLASIRASDDIDWYKFSISAPDNNVKVKLKTLPADYDIAWFNSSGQKIKQSMKTSTNAETMILNNLSGGTYYLRVSPKPGIFDFNNPYTLRVNASDIPFKLSDEIEADEEIALSVFPNPMNASSTITCTVAKPSKVALDIFDLHGRKVSSIVEGKYEAGSYKFSFDRKDLSPGVYLLQLQTDSGMQTEKLMIQ